MNPLFAASLFDNPWVLAVIVLTAALSQWLMRRRQANQANTRPVGDEPLPSLGQPQARSPRQPDLQEALRQLLGGEPPPRAPLPPPISPVMRDAQPPEGWSDEEPFQTEQGWTDEPQETYEAARPPAIQTAPSSRAPSALARANATRVEASKQQEKAARRFEQLNEPGKHPATVANPESGRHPHENTRAIGLLRDHRTVRQTFVASLVFGPPKAFES